MYGNSVSPMSKSWKGGNLKNIKNTHQRKEKTLFTLDRPMLPIRKSIEKGAKKTKQQRGGCASNGRLGN